MVAVCNLQDGVELASLEQSLDPKQEPALPDGGTWVSGAVLDRS